jgi:creatinine amidohydrolase/Fe(II)-dependent formamide hydrolase-like protein
METSAMLAFYPQFVDMSLSEDFDTDEVEDISERIHTEGVQAVSKSGILGKAKMVKACAKMIHEAVT